jgi:peptidoglycan hydrolase-like protein with peptidoglycan-binding domain
MFLKKGMQNQNVRRLQEKLDELGLDAGPADGDL